MSKRRSIVLNSQILFTLESGMIRHRSFFSSILSILPSSNAQLLSSKHNDPKNHIISPTSLLYFTLRGTGSEHPRRLWCSRNYWLSRVSIVVVVVVYFHYSNLSALSISACIITVQHSNISSPLHHVIIHPKYGHSTFVP
jgi:hypothetical protein